MALPVVVFLGPLVELMAVAVGMAAAPALAALMTLVLLMVLPALEWLERPNRWWAPLTSLGVALACLAWGASRAEPGPDRPAPSTLLLAVSRDPEGRPGWARWVTLAGSPLARDWVESDVGGPFLPDSAGLVDGFLLPDRPWLLRETSVVPAIAPPRVVVFRDAVVGGERRVRLGILSRAGAESIAVTAPDGVSFQGVAGTPGSAADLEPLGPSVRTLVHWGRTDPDLTVALAGPAGVPWDVVIVERFEGPVPGSMQGAFERPPSLIPDVTTGSDRTLVRTPYTVGDPVLAGPWPDSITNAAPGAPRDSTALPDTPEPPDSAAVPDSSGAPDSIRPPLPPEPAVPVVDTGATVRGGGPFRAPLTRP